MSLTVPQIQPKRRGEDVIFIFHEFDELLDMPDKDFVELVEKVEAIFMVSRLLAIKTMSDVFANVKTYQMLCHSWSHITFIISCRPCFQVFKALLLYPSNPCVFQPGALAVLNHCYCIKNIVTPSPGRERHLIKRNHDIADNF